MKKKAGGFFILVFLLSALLAGCRLIRIEEGERKLLGPSKEDKDGEPSCPCIVLKIKNTTKPVEFF